MEFCIKTNESARNPFSTLSVTREYSSFHRFGQKLKDKFSCRFQNHALSIRIGKILTSIDFSFDEMFRCTKRTLGYERKV